MKTNDLVPLAAIHANAMTSLTLCLTDDVVCFRSQAVSIFFHNSLLSSFWFILLSSIYFYIFFNFYFQKNQKIKFRYLDPENMKEHRPHPGMKLFVSNLSSY